MSDRHIGYTVVLAEATRDDDAEEIRKAISMIKGVAKVVPQVAGIESYAAEQRAKLDLRLKILEILE